jgi:predicted ABC-type ATPase
MYIIAGCNGAGKTTASYTVLPEMLNCREFVNADEIARGLSPFQPETVSFQAGRIMLERIHELLRGGYDFAFETTLSSRGHIHIIRKAKQLGYSVVLIFFWLESADLARARVRARVEKGGHHIPGLVIDRRYSRGIKNFFAFYCHLVDSWIMYDNSGNAPSLIAMGKMQFENTITNGDLWNQIITSVK